MIATSIYYLCLLSAYLCPSHFLERSNVRTADYQSEGHWFDPQLRWLQFAVVQNTCTDSMFQLEKLPFTRKEQVSS